MRFPINDPLVVKAFSKELESWVLRDLPWLQGERRSLSKREVVVNRMKDYQRRLRDARRVLSGEDIHEDCC